MTCASRACGSSASSAGRNSSRSSPFDLSISRSAPDSEMARCWPRWRPEDSVRSNSHCTGERTPAAKSSVGDPAVVDHVQVEDGRAAELLELLGDRSRREHARGAQVRHRQHGHLGLERAGVALDGHAAGARRERPRPHAQAHLHARLAQRALRRRRHGGATAARARSPRHRPRRSPGARSGTPSRPARATPRPTGRLSVGRAIRFQIVVDGRLALAALARASRRSSCRRVRGRRGRAGAAPARRAPSRSRSEGVRKGRSPASGSDAAAP